MPDYTPDYRYIVQVVTTPAGTAQASPQTTSFNPGLVTLAELQIVIPDGHAGQTGIAVVYDNLPIIPWGLPIGYVIGNNEEPAFPLDMTIGHALQVWTYNTGAFDHKHYLRYKVRDSSLDLPGQLPPLPVVKVIEAPTTTSDATDAGDVVDEAGVVA